MGDTGAFQPIGIGLAGAVSHNSTGGSFAYDPDQMRDIIRGWRHLGTDYIKSWHDAELMTQVTGPGLDYASDRHASAANQSGGLYRDALDKAARYCIAQANKYQKALDQMLGIDEDSSTDVSKSGGDVLDGGI